MPSTLKYSLIKLFAISFGEICVLYPDLFSEVTVVFLIDDADVRAISELYRP
jgi:hypothetical protein